MRNILYIMVLLIISSCQKKKNGGRSIVSNLDKRFFLMQSSSIKQHQKQIVNQTDTIQQDSKRPIYFYSYEDNSLFCKAYPLACEAFFKVIKENKILINDVIVSEFGQEPAFVLSIASPEICWYSFCRDKMETLAAEIFYIQLGNDYADFSIGIFQMKPTFIEKLEKKYAEMPELNKYSKQIEITGKNEVEVRRVRIARLKETVWQLRYLSFFCTFMVEKHRNKLFASLQDKLRFFASAYNCGFDRDDETILKQVNLCFFPYGKRAIEKNFNYSGIALYFFNHFKNDSLIITNNL